MHSDDEVADRLFSGGLIRRSLTFCPYHAELADSNGNSPLLDRYAALLGLGPGVPAGPVEGGLFVAFTDTATFTKLKPPPGSNIATIHRASVILWGTTRCLVVEDTAQRSPIAPETYAQAAVKMLEELLGFLLEGEFLPTVAPPRILDVQVTQGSITGIQSNVVTDGVNLFLAITSRQAPQQKASLRVAVHKQWHDRLVPVLGPNYNYNLVDAESPGSVFVGAAPITLQGEETRFFWAQPSARVRGLSASELDAVAAVMAQELTNLSMKVNKSYDVSYGLALINHVLASSDPFRKLAGLVRLSKTMFLSVVRTRSAQGINLDIDARYIWRDGYGPGEETVDAGAVQVLHVLNGRQMQPTVPLLAGQFATKIPDLLTYPRVKRVSQAEIAFAG